MAILRALRDLQQRLGGPGTGPRPTLDQAAKLSARTAHVPLFAHSYPFILNMDHAGFTPADLAEFANRNELSGLCLHIADGGDSSVSRMTAAELEAFRRLLAELGLALHLEISSTERQEIGLAADLAAELGVENIRLYARHSGPLSAVLEAVYADLAYAAELANARDLHFDYEQHEDLRAAEIAGLVQRVGDARLNVLFDFANSWNAFEEPLDALHTLRPWIRQVHLKGARKTVSHAGWGQEGVPQGSADDQVPTARLLHELLLLGETRPQVIAFALENEVGYIAPPFRGPHEPADPFISPRPPSQTPPPADADLAGRLRDERRWAQQQVTVTRLLLAELRMLAEQVIKEASSSRAQTA